MRHRGFTLVELVLSLAIATILLGGMTSAVFLATRAMPGEARPVEQITRQTQAVSELAEELAYACNLTERTACAVTFTLADRDADGSPESVRYSWSEDPGDPLLRQYNGGTSVSVLDDVREFVLTYDAAAVDETYPGPPVESAEYVLSSRTSASNAQNFAIKDRAWMGQYFCPTFPAGTLSWKVTRAQVNARYKGALNGVTAVQLRPALSGNLPGTQVLDQTLMYENKLRSSYRWEEFAFANAGGLSPGTGLCLLLVREVTDADLAEVQYDNAGSDLLFTNDAGANWYYYDYLSLMHCIYGTYSSPGPPQTATRRYVTGVRCTLRAGDSAEQRMDTAVRTINAPEEVSGIWETEFDLNPTSLDMNGDGLSDWVPETGSFDPARLSGGIWNANSNLLTSPDCDFTQLTTIDFRLRCTSVGGTGAGLRINADRSGSKYVPLYASLLLSGNGTQTLRLSCKPDVGTEVVLLAIPDLTTDFVDVRLLIDPALNTVNVHVNETDRGTFSYALSNDDNASHAVALLASGTTAQFDYVRIRVGGN